MKKRIISVICIFVLLMQNVSASVLGTGILGWSHDIARGTALFKNTFMSDQDGVGQQVEYYAEYTPNKSIVPAVVSGEEMWGFDKITEAEQYMKENNMVPILGINASYFSLKTGIPMGHVISNGKIISKDTETYQTIGFLPDGSAFIAPLSIKTTLHHGEKEIDIAHINKYNQEFMDIANLYTPEFAEHNHNDFLSLNLILGELDGELAIGEELTAVVEEKFTYHGAIKIPDDKIVLTINEVAKPELFEAVSMLKIGDTVTISSEVQTEDDYEWKNVDSALGSVGETLIKDGEIQKDFPSGSAPRTAVGITENGNIIFYVIDGRQKPYSYGVKVETLAKRMRELGCVDAINLDGGGSTIISGVYPGSDTSTVFNSPSDGKPRGVSNYIFLRNTKAPTNKADKLYIYPFEEHYLSGYTDVLTPKAVDSEYYPAKLPSNVRFSVDGTESTIDKNGRLSAAGTGEFLVKVSGEGIEGEASYTVYETPTNIDIYGVNRNSKSDSGGFGLVTDLKVMQGDIFELVDIVATYENITLKSDFDCFRVTVPEEIGYMENNKIIITAEIGESMILVSAGEYTKEIPITVKRENPFFDTDTHWAKDMIKGVYEKGIVKGVILDGKPMFMPDNNITREEFAVIVCNFANVDISEIKEYDLSVFADEKQISGWAKPYVDAAFKMGVLNGKADGNKVIFAPQDTLTRTEIMTALGRIITETDEDEAYDKLTFEDVADIPDWALENVKKMANNGFVSGYDDNTIRPANNITRAEAATIIFNMCKD